MKALCVQQPWASMIAAGLKTIETRTWRTSYRGELLIAASKNAQVEIENLPRGKALAIANLVECRPMLESDEIGACCPIYPRAVAWVFSRIIPIQPFDVRGQLGIFEVDYEPHKD